MSRKTVITCALTGLLTDPAVHNVPVTPKEMADHTEQAFNEVEQGHNVTSGHSCAYYKRCHYNKKVYKPRG